MSEERLIVGLGNPGKDYEFSRHNLGFFVLQHLIKICGFKLKASQLCKGLIAEGIIEGKNCCFLTPLTFMNHSGLAVKQFIDIKKITINNILVVCDDLNLEFGKFRVRRKGSDGGHNGLKSIIYHLNSKEFPRLRLGIGRGASNNKESTVDYVLNKFSKNEIKELRNVIPRAADCCKQWIAGSIDEVMSQFN